MSEHTIIKPDDVIHMAQLSRLAVSEEEKPLFARQFGDILGYMDVLAGVNVEGVEPLYSPVAHSGRPREDNAENRRERDAMLANAPQNDGEYFIVPRIV